MKKTVATFGLASGIVATAMTLVTIPFIHSASIETADVLGYTSMVLSALLVFPSFGTPGAPQKRIPAAMTNCVSSLMMSLAWM